MSTPKQPIDLLEAVRALLRRELGEHAVSDKVPAPEFVDYWSRQGKSPRDIAEIGGFLPRAS